MDLDVGITTTGVTGSATLDNVSMRLILQIGLYYNFKYGSLKVKYSGLGVATAILWSSLIEKLTSFSSVLTHHRAIINT